MPLEYSTYELAHAHEERNTREVSREKSLEITQGQKQCPFLSGWVENLKFIGHWVEY